MGILALLVTTFAMLRLLVLTTKLMRRVSLPMLRVSNALPLTLRLFLQYLGNFTFSVRR